MIDHSKPAIDSGDVRAVVRVLRSRHLVGGNAVPQFEQAMSRALGTRRALATDSGTAAIHLALLGLKIGRGDEVILPSHVHAVVLDAILAVGATPVLVDAEPQGFSLQLADVRRRLSRRTKAIIAIHLFGEVAELRPLLALGPPVIEDCAHALGARYRGRPVGSWGRCAIASLFATKPITTGHGGILATGDAALLRRARAVRETDGYAAYRHVHFNYQMSNLEAALGLSQLQRLRRFVARRRAIETIYRRTLGPWTLNLPATSQRRHIVYRYLVRVPAARFARVQQALQRQGIEAKRPIFKPIHQYLGLPAKRFPHTERLFREGLSIPIYPSLTNGQACRVADAVAALL